MTAQDAKVCLSVWKFTSSSFALLTAFSYAFRRLWFLKTRADSLWLKLTSAA